MLRPELFSAVFASGEEAGAGVALGLALAGCARALVLAAIKEITARTILPAAP
ncbi:MAG TPA: hypothetical protein VGQ72_06900 [Pyrinomonadaceae bacterium]|nr:hypothetical protein [Pyrinomonadaceae bacterium]